jgi:hypothetical protein
MMTEQEKLCNAVDVFAVAMKHRLVEKEKQGFSGWDDKDIHSNSLPTRLMLGASRVYALMEYSKTNLRKKMLIDIANYAMMIWRKLS